MIEFSRFVSWVPRKPYLALAISLTVLVTFGYFGRYSKQEGNVDFFVLDDDDNRRFEEFKKIFNKNEFFVVALKRDDIFSTDTLQVLKEITQHLAALPSVTDVKSLTNVDYTHGTEDSFSVRRFITKVPTDNDELLNLKETAIAEALYVPALISKDGNTASIVVFVDGKGQDESFRGALLDQVKQHLSTYSSRGYLFHLAGWTITNWELSTTLQRDLSVFVPLCFILISGTIYLVFRSFWLVLAAVLNLGASLVSIYGLFGFLGITINNLTAIAIPLGIILALADTVHVFSHLESKLLKIYGHSRVALAAILSGVVRPCLLTSLTTAVGFFSLSLSQLAMLREFSLIAGSAMAFEFFYSFFFLPAILALLPPERIFSQKFEKGHSSFSSVAQRFYDIIAGRPALFFVGCLMTGTLAGWAMFSVPVETNVTNCFREGSEFRKELSFVESNLGGVATFDVLVSSPQPYALKTPEGLKYIEKLADYLRKQKGVDHVSGLDNFFKGMHKAFHGDDPQFYQLPDSQDLLEQYLLLYDGKDLKDTVDNTFQNSRISVRLSIHSTAEQRVLLNNLRNFISEHDAPMGVEARPLGSAVNYVNVAIEMVDSQLSSFATATIVIGGLMVVALRSWKLAILSLLPNIFPVLLTFGVMGVFQIPLDTGTVMIASIALGIACDDTIHFLFDYRERRLSGLPIPDALRGVFLHKGRAISATSAILILGFSVLLFGDFIPVVNFGLLSAVAMGVGVPGDMVLLPSFILVLAQLGVKSDRGVGETE